MTPSERRLPQKVIIALMPYDRLVRRVAVPLCRKLHGGLTEAERAEIARGSRPGRPGAR